jgi:hypothetical protein
MYRSLNYSHPVEAYMGKQLTDLQTSTILRFTYEYSDYVAVMRQAALPTYNYMSKKAKHELVHSMLARQWVITSQVQFNGLGTQRVMRLLQVKATPRSLDEFYYSLKDNSLGEVEITISNFNKFYEAYQQYRVYFEYVYVFLSQYCDPYVLSTIVEVIVRLRNYLLIEYLKTLVKRCYLVIINRNLRMLHQLKNSGICLTHKLPNSLSSMQFDRRLVGDSKDKSKDIGKTEPYCYQKATDLKPTANQFI